MSKDQHNRTPEPLSSAELMADAQSSISDEELMLAKPGFLDSVSSAKQVEVRLRNRFQLVTNLARAAAVVLVFAGLAYASKYAFKPETVIAGQLSDFTAVVISNFTNQVVPGVEVYRVGTGELFGTNILVGVTNPNGIVTLANPKEQPNSQYEFTFDGSRIARVDLGKKDSNASGIYKVWVNVKPLELEKKMPIHLEPGQSSDVGNFRISLDNSTEEPWDGTVVLNRAWPAIFNYGYVVDGIISLDGPQNSALSISMGLPDGTISGTAEWKLVSHDSNYENSEPGWKSRFHRGWYNTGNPPLDNLPHEDFGVSQKNDSNWLEWKPRIRAPYVILRKPPSDGEVAACYRQVFDESGILYQQRGLEFINQNEPGIWLYEWLYWSPSGVNPYYFPEYFHKSHQYQPLTGELRPRGAIDAGYRWPPLLGDDELRIIPGEFSVNRYDFTVCDPVEFPRIKADFTNPPGSYRFKIEKGEVGSISRIELKGQLNRIAQKVEWDVDTDLIADKFGNAIELLIPSYGSYHISAQIKEKCGNNILLKTKLNFSNENVVGYIPSMVTDFPIVKGLDTPTEQTDSLWVMSAYSTSNLQAHSYSIGFYAGPLMYVKPPKDFEGVPLKEARLIAYISPRSGDYKSLPLSFIFEPVTLDAGSEYPFSLDKTFSPFLESNSSLSAQSTSWIARQAIHAHYDKSSAQNATSLLEAWQTHPTFFSYVERFIGVDLFDLPDEDQLVIKLEEFQDSEVYNVHYVSEEHQEITMRLPLPDGQFGADTGFYTGIQLETLNLLLTAQWEIFSGKEYPTRVEIETLDGRIYTQYFDYSKDY